MHRLTKTAGTGFAGPRGLPVPPGRCRNPQNRSVCPAKPTRSAGFPHTARRVPLVFRVHPPVITASNLLELCHHLPTSRPRPTVNHLVLPPDRAGYKADSPPRTPGLATPLARLAVGRRPDPVAPPTPNLGPASTPAHTITRSPAPRLWRRGGQPRAPDTPPRPARGLPVTPSPLPPCLVRLGVPPTGPRRLRLRQERPLPGLLVGG